VIAAMEARADHPDTSADRRSGNVFRGGAGAEGPAGVEGHQPKSLHGEDMCRHPVSVECLEV
jgi:hypothetical protein